MRGVTNVDESRVAFEYEPQSDWGASGYIADGKGHNGGVASVTPAYRVQVHKVVRVRLFPVGGRPIVVG